MTQIQPSNPPKIACLLAKVQGKLPTLTSFFVETVISSADRELDLEFMYMSDLDYTNKNKVDVSVFSTLEPEKIEGFKNLLLWLIQNEIIPVPQLLAGIWIVPHDQIPIYVNQIIKNFDKDALPYESGKDIPSGVAVPVEKDGIAVGFVILGDTILDGFTSELFFYNAATSTIIEEILHVELYSLKWNRVRYVRSPRDKFLCQTDFYSLCSIFHDEYAVNRWKTKIFHDNFSTKDENDSLIPIQITYGEPLDKTLNRTAIELSKVINEAAEGKISISTGWGKFGRLLLKGIFDPLARNEAYKVVNPFNQSPNDNAKNSWFSQYIEPYWKLIQFELEKSYDSHFELEEEAISKIVTNLEAFSASIGVSYHEIDNGNCWVDFSTIFFDQLDDLKN